MKKTLLISCLLMLLAQFFGSRQSYAAQRDVDFSEGWYAVTAPKASPAQLTGFSLAIEAGNHAQQRTTTVAELQHLYKTVFADFLHTSVTRHRFGDPHCKSYLVHIHPYHNFW